MLPVVRIVIAPDSFEGTLTADDAATAIAAGLRRVLPDADLVLLPVADGGEGPVAAAVRAGHSSRTVSVSGPDGAAVQARFALRGTTAVLELAAAAGPDLLDRPAPMTATTRGVGELVLAALDAGARRIVLDLGGAATTDGGAGMLQALGARLLDAAGTEVGPGGGGLATIARMDLTALDPRLRETTVVVATDVDSPLTGPSGAAAVSGPQKGATEAEVALLDAALSRYASVLMHAVGAWVERRRGAGAAGGTAAGAMAVLGAEIVSGAALLCDLVGLDAELADADLVITGEGAFDEQTLRGRAPAEVAARARAAGVPCVVLAGAVALPADRLTAAGVVAAHALTEVEPDVTRCRSDAAAVLARLAERVVPDRFPSDDAR